MNIQLVLLELCDFYTCKTDGKKLEYNCLPDV